MESSTADSVTIDRSYFDTLIRRAAFSNDSGYGTRNSSISISTVEYDRLVEIAHQFANLRRNLMNGGIEEETINLLSQDGSSQPYNNVNSHLHGPTEEEHDGGVLLNPAPKSFTAKEGGQNGYYSFGEQYISVPATPENGGRLAWADERAIGNGANLPNFAFGGLPAARGTYTNRPSHGQPEQVEVPQRPQYPRLCKRTIALNNLHDSVTYADITENVRGGLLLDVHLRHSDHMALISFLLEEDAEDFYRHIRKNDLYLKGRRVFIRWADRHFHLPGHVANKIGIGATRNLVVRRNAPHHTEEGIRDDLEHINNLVVIKVEFIGGSCHIQTNSVHNAMFARTCMMSRAKYKGSKVEWDVDECALPIKTAPKVEQPKAPAVPIKKAHMEMKNRFATLRLDDDDNADDTDKLDTSSIISSTAVDVVV